MNDFFLEIWNHLIFFNIYRIRMEMNILSLKLG